jgi:hypothetical protein
VQEAMTLSKMHPQVTELLRQYLKARAVLIHDT